MTYKEPVKKETFEKVKEICEKRHAKHVRYWTQMLLGQVMVWEILNGKTFNFREPLPSTTFNVKFGPDDKYRISVNTVGRQSMADERDCDVNVPSKYKSGRHPSNGKLYSHNTYCFCSFNHKSRALEILGWIAKERFDEKSKFTPRETWRARGADGGFTVPEDMETVKGTGLFLPFQELIDTNLPPTELR